MAHLLHTKNAAERWRTAHAARLASAADWQPRASRADTYALIALLVLLALAGLN